MECDASNEDETIECAHKDARLVSRTQSAIRHAEKRRTATCRFADRVAKVSVDHYKATIPANLRPPQTCIATIVAHIRNQSDDEHGSAGTLRVMAMGVGTKFLSEACLRQERCDQATRDTESSTSPSRHLCYYGMRVRDLHAEILARRAFRRQLTLEILADLKENANSDESAGYILIRSQPSGPTAIRYKLNEGVTLHMYTSSAPCGNATLKKFSKMSKERFRDDLGPDEWPNTPHEPPAGHGIKQGEFALLIKKDASSDTCNDSATCPVTIDATIPSIGIRRRTINEDSHESPSTSPLSDELKRSMRRGKPCAANASDCWTPPGTTVVGSIKKGSIHTCSDKLCRWNFLGIQGSLLASLLDDPLFISTLTVGRKLSGSICRRAVCCRLVSPRPIKILSSCSSQSENLAAPGAQMTKAVNEAYCSYRVNHPAVLGTAVLLDEHGVVETKNDSKGQDVRFHSSLSWAWWPGSPSEEVVLYGSSDGMLECIDGCTGFLSAVPGSEMSSLGTTANKDNDASLIVPSQLCTQELTKIFMQVDQLVSSTAAIIKTDESGTQELASYPSTCFVTLKELHALKKEISPLHEHVKECLFTEHRVFSHWRRRIDDYHV